MRISHTKFAGLFIHQLDKNLDTSRTVVGKTQSSIIATSQHGPIKQITQADGIPFMNVDTAP